MKRSPIRPRRATTRRSSRVRDVGYMLRVKELPCCLAGLGCAGPIEADHVGERGLGQKSDDAETVPLCRQHHRERTDFSGYFRDFDRERMRGWCAVALRVTRALLAVQLR